MPNWKITLSYDGSQFHGWQVQPGGLRTIQGTLAEALRSLTGESILPQGSGRTDAGVHALAQVASFELHSSITAANLHRALNRALPGSIRVLSTESVPSSFHARHSARGKTYEYRLFERRALELPGRPATPERLCSPFVAPFVWDCHWPVSLERMQQAAAHLLGTHDFTSFAASDPDSSGAAQNPVKIIHSAEWLTQPLSPWPDAPFTTDPPGRLLTFRITGSGFLHHMVRNLVGTLVDVGRGATDPTAIPAILAARRRPAAGPTAPARGLFLVHVNYDEAPIGENSPTA